MKNVPITLTFSENFMRDLHTYVPKRKFSKFFYELAQKEIEKRKQDLAQAFREAAQDEDLNAESELWDACIGDGIDDSNEYKKG
jgi:hypothetical protein